MTEQEQRQLISSDTKSEKEKENAKAGCPQSGVWKHFDRGKSRGDGHWEGTCKYCKKFYPQVKPSSLHVHLANYCEDVPKE